MEIKYGRGTPGAGTASDRAHRRRPESGAADVILLVVAGLCLSLLTGFWLYSNGRRTNRYPSTPVASVVLFRRMLADRRVGRRTKLILLLPICYVISPIQVVPSFIPVLGQLDDVLVVAVCLRVAARQVRPDLLRELWPGEPAALDRLLRRSLRRRQRHGLHDPASHGMIQ
jgi:uncharacterized membrane protein YkvA (DUF1232 family)